LGLLPLLFTAILKKIEMEVHHHAHTERKKWTHYFWEFFMLFLAVTLGFLVENQREHYIEHQREKKYAQLLYSDLKTDTARLNSLKNFKLLKAGKLDSLKSILISSDIQHQSPRVYYYTLFINISPRFLSQDVTMQQLRSSGNFRYFKNIELYNSISHYYRYCDMYLDREADHKDKILYPDELISKIFDTRILIEYMKVQPNTWNYLQVPQGNPLLLTTDKQILNQYYLFIGNIKWIDELSLLYIGNIEKNAINLMELLKKEYNIK